MVPKISVSAAALAWFAALGVLGPGRAGAETASDAVLMQDLGRAHLEPLSSEEEKRRFLNTVQIEKMRIQKRMLSGVYESAYELYRQGEFENAQDVSARILAIDPTFEDAALLRSASQELRGSPGARFVSEKRMLEERFKAGLELYHDNRLVEAQRKFEEILKLSPGHLKARYWLRRIEGERSDIHYQKGLEAYQRGDFQKALEHWYGALLLNPQYPRLTEQIARVEAEKRDRDSNRLMQEAITLLGEGRTKDSMAKVKEILQINPGDSRALHLETEIKLAIAERHVAQGRAHHNAKRYGAAVKEFREAEKWGYDKEKARALASRAKESMRKEAEGKRRREEELARRKAEQAEEEEALKKKEEEEQDTLKKKKEKEEKEGELSFDPEGDAKKKKKREEVGDLEGRKILSASGDSEVSEEHKKKVTEAHKREAEQKYLNGMTFMQSGQLEKAKAEFEQAKKLDPGNMEVDSALRRIESMISGQ